jgi:hypothetical protein
MFPPASIELKDASEEIAVIATTEQCEFLCMSQSWETNYVGLFYHQPLTV